MSPAAIDRRLRDVGQLYQLGMSLRRARRIGKAENHQKQAVKTDPQKHRAKPHEVPHPALSSDTDPASEAVQLEIYRRMPAWRKFQLVEDGIRTSRALAFEGLKRRHPDARPEELRRRFMDLWLGEELAERVYGPLEDAIPSST